MWQEHGVHLLSIYLVLVKFKNLRKRTWFDLNWLLWTTKNKATDFIKTQAML